MRAAIFPGMGCQRVGMGRDILATFSSARDVFQRVEAVIGRDIAEIIKHGDQETLNLPDNAHVAIVASSLAVVETLKSEFGVNFQDIFDCVAGHSLGEYSAYYAADVMSLEGVIKVVHRRSEILRQSANNKGTMVAVIRPNTQRLNEWCADLKNSRNVLCDIATDNSPYQIVIAGDMKLSDLSIELQNMGIAEKIIPLPVSAPYHSPILSVISAELENALASEEWKQPQMLLYSNVTAQPVYTVEELLPLTVKHSYNKVRWRETIQDMVSKGVDEFVELGPTNMMTKINNQNSPLSSCYSLYSAKAIAAFADRISKPKLEMA